MPLLTRLKCDGVLPSGKPCPIEFYVGETDTINESAKMLQVTDAFLHKWFFCGIDCLRRWAAKFEYPKQEEEDEPQRERHTATTPRKTSN